jgi:hypothetical protein
MITNKPEYRALMTVLQKAQAERSARPGFVEHPTTPSQTVPEWARYEIEVMHAEANRLRSERGLGPILLEDIVRCDTQACGHVDYTPKFVLYCYERVCQSPSSR